MEFFSINTEELNKIKIKNPESLWKTWATVISSKLWNEHEIMKIRILKPQKNKSIFDADMVNARTWTRKFIKSPCQKPGKKG